MLDPPITLFFWEAPVFMYIIYMCAPCEMVLSVQWYHVISPWPSWGLCVWSLFVCCGLERPLVVFSHYGSCSVQNHGWATRCVVPDQHLPLRIPGCVRTLWLCVTPVLAKVLVCKLALVKKGIFGLRNVLSLRGYKSMRLVRNGSKNKWVDFLF